jgi:hypothetical protein
VKLAPQYGHGSKPRGALLVEEWDSTCCSRAAELSKRAEQIGQGSRPGLAERDVSLSALLAPLLELEWVSTWETRATGSEKRAPHSGHTSAPPVPAEDATLRLIVPRTEFPLPVVEDITLPPLTTIFGFCDVRERWTAPEEPLGLLANPATFEHL